MSPSDRYERNPDPDPRRAGPPSPVRDRRPNFDPTPRSVARPPTRPTCCSSSPPSPASPAPPSASRPTSHDPALWRLRPRPDDRHHAPRTPRPARPRPRAPGVAPLAAPARRPPGHRRGTRPLGRLHLPARGRPRPPHRAARCPRAASLTHPAAHPRRLRRRHRRPADLPATADRAHHSTTTAASHPRTPTPPPGDAHPTPPGRFDPDIAEHHGHERTGPRPRLRRLARPRPGRYQRVVLRSATSTSPAREAATAVQPARRRAPRRRRRHPGRRLRRRPARRPHRGDHDAATATSCIAKQHTDAPTRTSRPPRWSSTETAAAPAAIPLGTVTHDTCPPGPAPHARRRRRRRSSRSTSTTPATPSSSQPLTRGPVKRARRATATTTSTSATGSPAPPATSRLAQPPPPRPRPTRAARDLRVLPDGDPDALRLHGLRSDAESVHSSFKRTLIVDRAMSLGWRRGLVDFYCYAWYTNALTEQALQVAAGQSMGNLRGL